MPQVGSARKRGKAMPQKFRWRRMASGDGRRAAGEMRLLALRDQLALLGVEGAGGGRACRRRAARTTTQTSPIAPVITKAVCQS